MDDETDHLLDTFLVAASGERTDETRDRYRRTLDRLRDPGTGERGSGPGARLLLRIPSMLVRSEAGEFEADVQATAPSLWLRLITWLRRNTDAADPEARCILLEAQACLQAAQEAKRLQRYPVPQSWAGSSELSHGELGDEAWWADDDAGERWAEVYAFAPAGRPYR